MLEVIAHVKGLSDAELYQELQKHGYQAGPIVASTRDLYRRKLAQILEMSCSNGQEPLFEIDRMEEQTEDNIDNIFKSINKSESASTRSSFLCNRSLHKLDVEKPGRLNSTSNINYRFSKGEMKDKTQSAWKSPYLSSAELNKENNANPYSSLFKNMNSSVSKSALTNRHTSYKSTEEDAFQHVQTFGKSRFSQAHDESPLYSATNKSFISDISQSSGQENAARYRLRLSNEQASIMSKQNHNKEKQKRHSTSLTRWIIFCLILVLVINVLSYMVHSAWLENDPYRQIEDPLEVIVEQNTLDYKY